MKNFSIFITLFIVLCTQVSARENPFEATQTYETEFNRLMEVEEDYPYEFQEKEDQVEHKEIMPEKKVMTAKPMSEDEVKQMTKVAKEPVKMETVEIVKKKEITQVKKKMIVVPPAPSEDKRMSLDSNKKEVLEEIKPTISLENAMTELSEEKIEVQVPKRKDVVIEESIQILPFVTVTYTNDKMEIDSKYEVFRKFIIEKSNKIVLDYHAKTFFLTKKQITQTEYFDRVVVGNHLKEKYFRVVLVLKQNPNKYKVTYTDNLVTIEFDKDMI